MDFQDLALRSSLDSYLVFKVFELFRDSFTNIVNASIKNEVPDLTKHIFIAPSSLQPRKSFHLKGIQLPYVGLWGTSPLTYNPDWYARSVLPRTFQYFIPDPKNPEQKIEQQERGFLQDFKKTYEVSGASYFKDFIGMLNFALLEFDRTRYFDISTTELLPESTTRCELNLDSLNQAEQVDERQGTRRFNLVAIYTLRITLPILGKSMFIDNVNLYLNDNKIWVKEIS